MLFESILEVARELPSCSAAPGGKAGPQAACETAGAAAGRADDAPPKGSTPQGAFNDHLPCPGTDLYHRYAAQLPRMWDSNPLACVKGISQPASQQIPMRGEIKSMSSKKACNK